MKIAHQDNNKSITRMPSELKDWIWTEYEAEEGTGNEAEIDLLWFLIG